MSLPHLYCLVPFDRIWKLQHLFSPAHACGHAAQLSPQCISQIHHSSPNHHARNQRSPQVLRHLCLSAPCSCWMWFPVDWSFLDVDSNARCGAQWRCLFPLVVVHHGTTSSWVFSTSHPRCHCKKQSTPEPKAKWKTKSKMYRCSHRSLIHGIVHILLLLKFLAQWETNLCQFWDISACGVARMSLFSFCLSDAFTCLNIDHVDLIHQRHQTFSSQAHCSNVRQIEHIRHLSQFCLLSPAHIYILDPKYLPWKMPGLSTSLPVAKLSGTWRVGEADLVYLHLQDKLQTPLDAKCITHRGNNAVKFRFTWTQRDDSLRFCWTKEIETLQHVQTAWYRSPVLFVGGPICIAVRFQHPEFCKGNLPLALWRLWTFQKNSKLTCCFQIPHQLLEVLKSSKCWSGHSRCNLLRCEHDVWSVPWQVETHPNYRPEPWCVLSWEFWYILHLNGCITRHCLPTHLSKIPSMLHSHSVSLCSFWLVWKIFQMPHGMGNSWWTPGHAVA